MPRAAVTDHRSLSQRRSEDAWQSVGDAVKQLKDKYAEYVNLVKKLPAMVCTNGLGQSLAFLAAKAKMDRNAPTRLCEDNAHGLLYRQLEKWLFAREIYKKPTDNQIVEPLILLLSCGTSARYRQATAEIQGYVVWLKQYAECRETKDRKTGKAGAHGSEAEPRAFVR